MCATIENGCFWADFGCRDVLFRLNRIDGLCLSFDQALYAIIVGKWINMDKALGKSSVYFLIFATHITISRI